MPIENDPSGSTIADRLIEGDEPAPTEIPRNTAPMLTIEQLREEFAAMKGDVDKAQNLLALLDVQIQRIKADGSRHPDYIREKIAEAQAKAIPAIAEIVRTFSDRLAPVNGQKRYWQSKPFLLSLLTFDDDPVRDTAIRTRYASEFSWMPPAWLQLVADEAIDAGKLAILYQAVLVSMGHAGKPGWLGISLDKVEVPDQAEGLELIEKCNALTATAHSIWGLANGKVLTGVEKMNLARQTAVLR